MGGDRFVRMIAGKEPVPGSAHPPPLAPDLEQCGGEHHIAIFLPFALLDTEDHALTVDHRNGEVHRF
jgi:hypothetical protein